MQTLNIPNLQEAASQFDRRAISGVREEAEKLRLELLQRFPISGWPTMPIENYALGQPGNENSFCRWMEFRTKTLASIRGGSSMKHMLFKRKGKEEWYFDKAFANKEAAWESLRSGFVEAIELAQAGKWDEIDGVKALNGGPALRMKTIYLYFPNDALPICATPHIKHFLQKVDPESTEITGGVVRLNRLLLSKLKAIPEFDGWTNWELSTFLYSWSHPRNVKHVVRISPGEKAIYWNECLSGNYICAGWDEVGDLNDSESKEELQLKLIDQLKLPTSNAKTKANELWALKELEPGDLVVANEGISRVLAIGEVQEPGYEFREGREQFKHTVAVKWDTSVAKDIPQQKKWAFTTVSKVPASLYELIIKGGEKNRPEPAPPISDSLFLDMEGALTTRGQVLMYGPPGTGKTYYARRMALWWLLREQGIHESEIVEILENRSRFLAEENALTRSRTNDKTWYVVANPQVWNWSQLKKEKKVSFHYGRLQRNYPVLKPGDLVVGYLSGTAKVIAAIAKVTKGLSTDSKGEPFIELEFVADVTNGLTYEEMLADPILANSEPLRFRNQGTLFALTESESDHLWGLLLERDPSIEAHLGSEDGIGQLTRVTFHPSYSYEDFIEGFRPVKNSTGDGLRLTLEDGLFKRVCRQAQSKPLQKFVVIIDELNRANVAKVFGELITLIEYDKRGLEVTLSQSKESFHVPKNVYIIGTMNTSDRSIRLLDSAFRRRFAFLEMMPNPDLFSGVQIGQLAVPDFLTELNRRISLRFGREKQIGHSFFMEGKLPIDEADEFANRFRREVLPLLQEYCFDDYSALAMILGKTLVDEESQELRMDQINDTDLLIEALATLLGTSEGADTE